MVIDAFVTYKNCLHHFHLALNLMCLHDLGGFCLWVVPVDPRFIISNYCVDHYTVANLWLLHYVSANNCSQLFCIPFHSFHIVTYYVRFYMDSVSLCFVYSCCSLNLLHHSNTVMVFEHYHHKPIQTCPQFQLHFYLTYLHKMWTLVLPLNHLCAKSSKHVRVNPTTACPSVHLLYRSTCMFLLELLHLVWEFTFNNTHVQSKWVVWTLLPTEYFG